MNTTQAINIKAVTAAITLGLLAFGPLRAEKITFVPVDGEESRISVDGTSNVHDWEAESRTIEGFIELDNDEFWNNPGTIPGRLPVDGDAGIRATVRIPAASVKSDSGRLTKNMHNALEVEDYAQIVFELESVELTPDNGDNPEDEVSTFATTVEGALTISGDTGRIAIPVEWSRDGDRLVLTGEVELKMSDFGVDPPTMMFGALRTADEVTIDFVWILEPGSRDNR